MPNTNDLQIEGDFWEAICILWDWAFESISVPQSKGIGQQHPPQVNLKWEKICTFLKEMQAKLPEMSKSTILWFIIFSQPGSGKWMKGEFFSSKYRFFISIIFQFWSHSVSLLPPPQVWIHSPTSMCFGLTMSTFRRVTLTIVKAMCPPVSLLLRLADKKNGLLSSLAVFSTLSDYLCKIGICTATKKIGDMSSYRKKDNGRKNIYVSLLFLLIYIINICTFHIMLHR